jgi:hypothetical protein
MIDVDFREAYRLIIEITGCGPSQKDISEAIGLGQGDLANRKKRGTAAQYIIDWGAERGVAAENLFPELKGLRRSALTWGAGDAVFPSMLDGSGQNRFAFHAADLERINAIDPRVFIAPKDNNLLPHWGIFDDDVLLVETSINQHTFDGVYVLEMKGEPVLHAVLRRGNRLLIEQDIWNKGGNPVPKGTPVLGRVHWRGGLVY